VLEEEKRCEAFDILPNKYTLISNIMLACDSLLTIVRDDWMERGEALKKKIMNQINFLINFIRPKLNDFL
jgi:hypothetical protein